jgi:hypothetical protein
MSVNPYKEIFMDELILSSEEVFLVDQFLGCYERLLNCKQLRHSLSDIVGCIIDKNQLEYSRKYNGRESAKKRIVEFEIEFPGVLNDVGKIL